MNEQEYREHPALNYSTLADFDQGPAVALMPKDDRWHYHMGHAFERLLQDTVTGSRIFPERYVVVDTLPDAVPTNILDMLAGLVEIRTKKDGAPYAGEENKAEWLAAISAHPGKIPLNGKTFAELGRMVDHLLACQFMGSSLADLLAVAEWQQPHFWTKDGIEKKALFDAVVMCEWYEAETAFALDIKTAATLANFRSFCRSKYWIQDRHYIEGLQHRHRSIFPTLVFAVVTTTEPWLAQCFTIRENEALDEAYRDLCRRCDQWQKQGAPAVAWLPQAEINVWR